MTRGGLARFLEGRDCPCPGCGYNLRGLRGDRCPECSRRLRIEDMHLPVKPLTWAVRAVDLHGLFALIGVNVVLVGLLAWLHLGLGRRGWFTARVFHVGRGPDAPSSLLLCALAAVFLAWGAAWGRSSFQSFFWQRCCAMLALALTIAHAVGVASLVW